MNQHTAGRQQSSPKPGVTKSLNLHCHHLSDNSSRPPLLTTIRAFVCTYIPMAPRHQTNPEDLDTTHLLAEYPESSSAPEVMSSPQNDTMDQSKGLPPAYTPSASVSQTSEPSYPNPLTFGYVTPPPMTAQRPSPSKNNPTFLAVNCCGHHDTFTHACLTINCCGSSSQVTRACCGVNMCASESLLDRACCAVNLCGSRSELDRASCGVNLCASRSLLSKACLGVDLCGSLSKLGKACFAVQCCTGEEEG